MFGAAIGSSGSQIAGMLRSLGGELRSPEGKKFIHRFMLRQVGPMQQEFVNRADDWAQANLLAHPHHPAVESRSGQMESAFTFQN